MSCVAGSVSEIVFGVCFFCLFFCIVSLWCSLFSVVFCVGFLSRGLGVCLSHGRGVGGVCDKLETWFEAGHAQWVQDGCGGCCFLNCCLPKASVYGWVRSSFFSALCWRLLGQALGLECPGDPLEPNHLWSRRVLSGNRCISCRSRPGSWGLYRYLGS